MFREIEFMAPIREFLMSYPALSPSETLEVSYMKIDSPAPRDLGNAVAFVGMNRPQRKPCVDGNTILTEQANLIFIMRRVTNDNVLRRDIGDFIFNFIRWINYENEMRGTPEENPLLPRFGNMGEERILASGGMEIGSTFEPSVDEFQIQIQLEYQTMFCKRSEW